MKKKITFFLIFLMFVNTAYAMQSSGSTYTIDFAWTDNCNIQRTDNFMIEYGFSQHYIGDFKGSDYHLQVGLYYLGAKTIIVEEAIEEITSSDGQGTYTGDPCNGIGTYCNRHYDCCDNNLCIGNVCSYPPTREEIEDKTEMLVFAEEIDLSLVPIIESLNHFLKINDEGYRIGVGGVIALLFLVIIILGFVIILLLGAKTIKQ